MKQSEDILASLDLDGLQQVENTIFWDTTPILEEDSQTILKTGEYQEEVTKKTQAEIQKSSLFSKWIFLIKYLSTSVCIFVVLMLVSNYSAYWNIAYSFFYAWEVQETQRGLIESVDAAEIQVEAIAKEEVNTFKALEKDNGKKIYTSNMHSISQLANNWWKEARLGIEITPYEDRIVIPKIGKNIPLVDIVRENVEGVDELNDIFMKELENWVVRYPWSALPWTAGNSFIFGHSSNFPWLDGNYNDVFALLHTLEEGDDIIVYYKQRKYIYKAREQNVIRPGDVSVLKNTDRSIKELTLMTCWPIGTTYNRLLISAELVEIQ